MPDVGCAGILVEDTFCGPMPALPPAGALALLSDMPVRAGGCAANVAVDLRKQQISVDVVGCVGSDSAGEFLVSTLKKDGVGVSKVVRSKDHLTSKTVIVLIEGQDRRYLHVPGANTVFDVGHIPREWISTLKVFYLGGLFAMPGLNLADLAELLKFCRKAKVTTVVDVVIPQNVRGMEKLKQLLPFIDVFLPNEDEARAFTGLTDSFDQLRSFRSAGASTVIITRGAQGAVAARDRGIWSCGTYAMKVVDPSGSGDAFTAGVINSLLCGWDMPATLRYASAVGASATRTAGTTDSVFSAREAEAFLLENPMTVNNESQYEDA